MFVCKIVDPVLQPILDDTERKQTVARIGKEILKKVEEEQHMFPICKTVEILYVCPIVFQASPTSTFLRKSDLKRMKWVFKSKFHMHLQLKINDDFLKLVHQVLFNFNYSSEKVLKFTGKLEYDILKVNFQKLLKKYHQICNQRNFGPIGSLVKEKILV